MFDGLNHRPLTFTQKKELWNRICSNFKEQLAGLPKLFEECHSKHKFVKVAKSGYWLSGNNETVKFYFTVVGTDDEGNEHDFEMQSVCEIGDVREIL